MLFIPLHQTYKEGIHWNGLIVAQVMKKFTKIRKITTAKKQHSHQWRCFLFTSFCRLYIVHGVSRNTVFLPQTKKEIRSIRWFHLRDLPSFKKDPTPTERLGINSNAFFMIMPFVKPLRKMLNQLRQATGI